MRSGDIIVAPETRIYKDLDCEVHFRANGQLATYRHEFDLWHYGWATNTNSYCKAANDTMTWRLQRDGNFVGKCGNEIDYTTRTHQGSLGDYIMMIDNRCNLHILKGSMDCNSANLGEELWANEVRGRPLKSGDRIGKGERWYYSGKYFQMSNNGDFEVWRAASHGTKDTVWRAGAQAEWTALPGVNIHDHYAKVAPNGHLQLVGIDYTTRMESVYFDKDLSPNASVGACFIVDLDYGSSEYDQADNVLVAAPC